MSISASAVLVKLSISTWTAEKLDKVRTEQVLAAHNATGRAAQVRKNLMAGTKLVKDINDYAASCRLWHNLHTLPWEDRGNRTLATSMFLEYKREIAVRKRCFEGMVDDVRANYDAMCQTARHYLGSMYDAMDYPPVDEVMSKYAFNLVISPMPDAGHFYLDIPEQDLKEMKTALDKENSERMQTAMRSAWDRLHTTLAGMSAKLTEGDDDVKKRWHASFITNAQDLCKLLTHLNLTQDPELERARQMLEGAMSNVSIDSLKDNAHARVVVKDKVDAILRKFEW